MLRPNSDRINPDRSGLELTRPIAVDEPEALELLRQVQRLEEMIILDGVKLPLTGRKLVDEEQLLAQLTNVERSIPETIQTAEKILLKREDIIARANQYAQEIIKSAEQRAAQIADEVRIVQQAEREAQQIRQQVQQESDIRRQQVQQETEQLRHQVQQESELLRQRTFEEIERLRRQVQQEIDQMRQSARAECEQIQVDADNYADRVLTQMEQQFSEMLRVVQNGRQHLRSTPTGRPPV